MFKTDKVALNNFVKYCRMIEKSGCFENCIYVTDLMMTDRTTSVPKSVLRYVVDEVRSLDLETSLSQSCSPNCLGHGHLSDAVAVN